MLQHTSPTTAHEVLMAGKPRQAETSLELVPCLLMIAKRTRALLSIKLIELDLAVGQDQMLLVLEPGETMLGRDLAEALGVRPSTVSKMLDRLVAKGFLQRLSDVNDGRKVQVQLTPAGVKMKARISNILAEFEAELLHGLGENAAATIDATSQIDRVMTTRLRRLR